MLRDAHEFSLYVYAPVYETKIKRQVSQKAVNGTKNWHMKKYRPHQTLQILLATFFKYWEYYTKYTCFSGYARLDVRKFDVMHTIKFSR